MATKLKNDADRLLKLAYSEHYSSAFRLAFAKLKNNHQAEDCVQEAFLVLYKKYLNGEEIEFVRAFLFKTVNNLALKIIADNSRQAVLIPLEQVEYIPSQNEDVDDRLAFEQYSRQISKALSQSQGELFRLRYVDDLTIEQIAQATNSTIGAVTTSLSRIRKKLRDELGEDFFS